MGVKATLRASRLTATPAMIDDIQLSFSLPSVLRKKVTAAFDGGRLSSDSGVMLLALADRRRRVADTLAALIADPHDRSHITHTEADVLRARMLAISCGYPDGNDFDRLRCRIWYSISRTVSDDDAHRRRHDDRSDRAFAVKPRAYGAPQKRHWGLTARCGRANPAAVLILITARPQ